MLSRNHPDRIRIAFDDHRLVANAGLILPSTLALHLGLPQLVDRHLDLGHATGRANTGDKMMTLVASALASGDCINDADALRAGGTARVLGFTAKAPSTLGAFLRSFRWGHVRQLDRVSRELLALAWAAGAGPGDGPDLAATPRSTRITPRAKRISALVESRYLSRSEISRSTRPASRVDTPLEPSPFGSFRSSTTLLRGATLAMWGEWVVNSTGDSRRRKSLNTRRCRWGCR